MLEKVIGKRPYRPIVKRIDQLGDGYSLDPGNDLNAALRDNFG